MFRLKEYRDSIKGMSDLLNWAAMVDDGVILNKDGSFTAGFIYQGIDVTSASNLDRNDLCARINRILSELGSGWMIQTDAIRQLSNAYLPAESSHFTHPIIQLIDDSRRMYFESQGNKFTSTYVITLTYMPPSKNISKINDLVFEYKGVKPSIALKNLERFQTKILSIEGMLRSELHLERLRSYQSAGVWYDSFLSYLNFCVTGRWHPIQLPDCPMALDSYVGACDFWTGFTPKVDTKYISAISIDGFPPLSSPNYLASLDDLSCDYRWSTRFIFFDDIEAKKLLEKERKKWKQKVISFKDKLLKTDNPKVDEDALSMTLQYEAAETAISKGEVSYGQYSSTLILRHENIDVLNEITGYIEKSIREIRGLHCRIETVNATEAFLSTFPSDSIHNIRKPLLSTDNLTHLLPLNYIWTGNEYCPCPFYPTESPPIMVASAQGSSVFRLNLHVDDVGHTLVFGPTGSGKSTLLAMLVAQVMRYENVSIYAFDVGNSLYTLSQCGGQHFDIGKSSLPSFAPLSDLDDDFEWCCDFIVKLLVLHDVKIKPHHLAAIHTTLSTMRTSERKTLSEFQSQCQNTEIKEAIEYYTVAGRAGDLLDAESNTLTLNQFSVFEIDSLMKRGDKDSVPVLLYLFRQIEKRLTGDPAYIFIDEGWVAFKNAEFKNMLKEWLLVLRKANCIVVFSTQLLSAAIQSGILDVLMESCPTTIFLPNKKAVLVADTYQQFGLNLKQIQTIKTATRKREYFIVQDEHSRLIDLSLDAVALAFVGVSEKPEIKQVQTLVKQYGDDWYLYWLKEKGLHFENGDEN